MAIHTAETPAAAQERIRLLREQQEADQKQREDYPTRVIPEGPSPGKDLNRPPASAMEYEATPENVLAKEAIAHLDRTPLGVAAANRRAENEKKAEEEDRPMKEMRDRMDGKNSSTGKYSEKSAADRIREMHMDSAEEKPQGGLRSDGLAKTTAPSGQAMLEKPGPVDIKSPTTPQSRGDAVREKKAGMAKVDAQRQAKPQFDKDGNQLPASTGVGSTADDTTVGNFGKTDTVSYRKYLEALDTGLGKTYGTKQTDEEGNVTYGASEAGYKEFVKDMTDGDEQDFAEEKFIPDTVRSEADPNNKGATKSGAVRGEKVDAAQEMAKDRGAASDDVTEGGKGLTAKELFEQEAGKDKTGKKKTWENATPGERAKYEAMEAAYKDNAGELRDESFAYRAHQMGKDNTDQSSANKDVRNMDRMTAKGDDERAKAEARFNGKSGADAENNANDRGDHIIGGMGGGYENRLNPNTGEYEMQKTQDRENLTHQRRIRNLLRTQMNNNPEQFMNRDGTVNDAAVTEWWEAHGGTDKVPGLENTGEVDADGNPIKTEAANIAATPFGSLGMDTKSRFEHRMKDMSQRKARVQDIALGASPAQAKYNADIQDMIANEEWQQAASLASRNGDLGTMDYLSQKMRGEHGIAAAAAGNEGLSDGPTKPAETPGDVAFNGAMDFLTSGGDPSSPAFSEFMTQVIQNDMTEFDENMLTLRIPSSSPQYQEELTKHLTRPGSQFNKFLNSMFSQAEPQPFEAGLIDRIGSWWDNGRSLDEEALQANRQPMSEFVDKILGSIGIDGASENKELRGVIGKMYLNRMMHQFPEKLGTMKEEFESQHPGQEWEGQGFILPLPAAEPEAVEPAPEPAAPDAWHKQPTTGGEIIDKDRAAEIIANPDSAGNIRSMTQPPEEKKKINRLMPEWSWPYGPFGG